VTDVLAVSVSVQVEEVPLHAPDHPVKVELDAGVSVSVTEAALAKLAVHVVPQLMLDGLLVTVPEPVPAVCTVSCTGAAVVALKFAVTEVSAPTVTVHPPVPLHAPDQPVNVERDAGVAMRVTEVPALNFAEQVWPQLIPAGLLITAPWPAPAFCTMS